MGGGNYRDPKVAQHSDDNAILDHARSEVQRFVQLREEMADQTEVVQNASKDPTVMSIDSFDFGNRGISQLPEELVDIIKDHAERLALDRNWLPSLSGLNARFAEFTRLKYLVVRFNELEEFPTAVLSVPTLEYLDLRANKITTLPDDLSRLKNIKVVCVKSNKIKRLPPCIANMNSMQFIVLDKNPIEFPEKKLWKVPHQDHDNERQRQIEETTKVKKLLQQHQSQEQRGTEGDSSETPAETPRIYKRRPGGRFPIKPSISGINIDGASDDGRTLLLAPKSALLQPKRSAGLPPTPRSAAIRPGIEPLANSDRHRSNSESLMSTSVRKKRMGIQMSRGGKGSAEGIDVDALKDEAKRLSHLRGASVDPALLNNAPISGSAITDSPDPGSPHDSRDPYYSRLSSLPENKRKSQHRDSSVELAQDVLFSLEQVEGPIRTVVHSLKSSGPKRRGLERPFQVFATSRAELSHALIEHGTYDEENETEHQPRGGRRDSADWVLDRCGACLDSFQKLSESLESYLPLIVEHVSPRHIRILMHMLYASTVEIRNAYGRMCAVSGVRPIEKPFQAPSAPEATHIVRSVSPLHRPTTSLRIRDPNRPRNASQPLNKNKPLPSPRMMSGGPPSAARFPTYAQRTQEVHNTLTPSLTPSTSFVSTHTAMNEYEEQEEDQAFESIFEKLSVAAASANQTLPQCSHVLQEAKRKLLDGFTTTSVDGAAEMYDLLLHHCSNANDAAFDLKTRLKTLKVREPRARDQSEFWQLCTALTRAYFIFATNVKSQNHLKIIPAELLRLLKPLHLTVKTVSQAIEQSPWRAYAVHGPNSGTPTSTDPGSAMFSFPSSLSMSRSSTFSSSTNYVSSPSLSSTHTTTPRTAQLPQTQSYASTHGLPNLALQTSFGSNSSGTTGPPTAFGNSFSSFGSSHGSSHTSNGHASGYTTPLPATPISAALGPAAHATIGSNGSGLGLYNGNGSSNGIGAHDHIGSSANGLPGWYNSALEGGVSRSGSTAGTNGLGLSRSTTASRSVSRSVSQRR